MPTAPDQAPGAAPQQQHAAAAQAGVKVEGQLGQRMAAAMGQARLVSPVGAASAARAFRRQLAAAGAPDMAARYLSCLGMGLRPSAQVAVKDEKVVWLKDEAEPDRLGAKRPRRTSTGVLGQLELFICIVMLQASNPMLYSCNSSPFSSAPKVMRRGPSPALQQETASAHAWLTSKRNCSGLASSAPSSTSGMAPAVRHAAAPGQARVRHHNSHWYPVPFHVT